MVVKTIVLTGGPCAGKTTALSWTVENFTKLGWKVLTITEAATLIIMSHVRPNVDLTLMEFQDLLMKTQIFLEDSLKAAIKKSPYFGLNDKILIVCDRGVGDGAAYLTDEEFEELLARNNLTLQEMFARYDAVFHLVTAADGASRYYTLVGNKARSETREEAIELDKRTQNAWVGHPHLRIISNQNVSFKQKLRKLMAEIASALCVPGPMEGRRKYLIRLSEDNPILKEFRKVEIMQTYLPSEGNREVYVRQRGICGDFTFTKTVCYDASDPHRAIELESRIEADEYAKSLIAADSRMTQIRKTRYCFVDQACHYSEVDFYTGTPDYALFEIEVRDKKEKVELPNWVNVVREVTDDPRFLNYEISRTGGRLPTRI